MFRFRQLRAATSSRYNPVRHESRKDARVKRNPINKNSSPDSCRIRSRSPKHLANAFITFLKQHGQTAEMALRNLNSTSSLFSPVHEILRHCRTFRHVANLLAASDHPVSCIRLLSLSVTYGLRLNASTYEGICWTLSRHRQYPLVLEVCRLAEDYLGMTTCRLLDWRLRANYELENFVAATLKSVLRDYKKAGVVPSRRTWHAVLTSHLRNRDLDGARQCLKLMERAGFPINHHTHAVIANNYRHLGYDIQVRDFAISAMSSLSPLRRTIVMNRLLQAQLFLKDESNFRYFLSFFENSAIGPLQIFTASGNDEGLTSPLPDLEHPITISPDYYTFLIGVRFCIIQSKFTIAEEIFSFMGEKGFEGSPTVLTAFLHLQMALGRHEFALSIASLLLSRCQPTDHRDQLQKCQLKYGVRWPFAASYVKRTSGPFNVLMRGLVTDLGLGAARSVLELMKATNIRPNSRTIKILIDHLIRFEKVTPSVGYRLLRQISPVLRPSLHHLHAMMIQLVRNEKARLLRDDKALPSSLSQESMDPKSPPSNEYSLIDPVIDPVAGLRFIWPGRPNLSTSLLQSLRSRGIFSDATLLGLRMRYEGVIRRDVSAMVDVYNDMLARGLMPLVYHVATLMETFVFRGEMEKALEIMHSTSIKPNVVLYTILLQGYASQGQTKAAAELFQSMIADGIQPDVRAICALCHAFVLTRQLSTARTLLLTLWPYVEPLPSGHAGLPLGVLIKNFRSLDTARPTIFVKNRNRRLFRQDIAEMIRKLKHVAGLSPEHLSNEVRKVAKKSIHVNRRTW